MSDLIPSPNIDQRIVTVPGVQVMLDRDLTILYEVETRALKQAVKRNSARFPHDFMFELTEDEVEILVSQSVIPSRKHLGETKTLRAVRVRAIVYHIGASLKDLGKKWFAFSKMEMRAIEVLAKVPI